MKRMLVNDEEGVSPVIAVILMVAITVVLAAVLYVWASSFIQSGENAPIMVMDSTKRSDGSYQISVISISAKKDIEAFQFFLKDELGRTVQDGEVGLQNISGVWHGVDITWDGKAASRADDNGGAYTDNAQAQERIDDVDAGNSPSGTAYQKGEGVISVYYYDNDFDGKLTAGDIFNVKGNGATHTADDDFEFELKYDITGDIVGTVGLGA